LKTQKAWQSADRLLQVIRRSAAAMSDFAPAPWKSVCPEPTQIRSSYSATSNVGFWRKPPTVWD